MLLFRLIAGRLPFDIAGLSLVAAVQRILQSETPRLGTDAAFVHESLEQIPPVRWRASGTHDTSLPRTWAATFERFSKAAARALPTSCQRPSVDDRLLAIGLTSGTISVIDARTGHVLVTFERRARAPSPVFAFTMMAGLPSSGATADRNALRLPVQH